MQVRRVTGCGRESLQNWGHSHAGQRLQVQERKEDLEVAGVTHLWRQAAPMRGHRCDGHGRKVEVGQSSGHRCEAMVTRVRRLPDE